MKARKIGLCLDLLIVLSALGADLTHMAEQQASGGTHTLTAAAVALPGNYATGSTTSGYARGYNGGIPGPTFRMVKNTSSFKDLHHLQSTVCNTLFIILVFAGPRGDTLHFLSEQLVGFAECGL